VIAGEIPDQRDEREQGRKRSPYHPPKLRAGLGRSFTFRRPLQMRKETDG
jgi:hypothetical protein